MTFTIPIWAMWTFGLVIGVPLIALILFYAYIGYKFFKSFNGGLHW